MKFAVSAVALLVAATATGTIAATIATESSPSDLLAAARKMQPIKHTKADANETIDLRMFSFSLDYTMLDLFFGTQWLLWALDTSRPDTWVADANCNIGCPAMHYHIEWSKNYKKTGDDFKIDYADVEGPVTVTGSSGTDDFYFGDAISGVTAKDVAFGIGSKAKRKLPTLSECAGVIGLGRQKNGASSFLSAWVKSGAIKSTTFSLLHDRAAPGAIRLGRLTLGGYDSRFTTNGLQYHSLLPDTDAWEIGLTDVLFNGASLGYKRTALFDSTSWTIRVPQKDAEEIYRKIPGSKRHENGIYEIPLDSKVQITLQFDGKAYPMDASDMCFEFPKERPKTCNAAIQASDTDKWILGHPFLVNVLAVFDDENKRIGLAQRDYSS